MNYIDALLIIIVLLSIWSGIQKGFVLGIIELVCWVGGLILTFLMYPYLVSFVEKFIPSISAWAVLFAFLTSLIVTRIILSYLADKLLTQIPAQIHTTPVNKISGIVPGAINGVIYAAIATVILMLLPLSEGITQSTSESKIADKLSASIEKVETRFAPVLNNVNRSISRVTVKPGVQKFVELNFKVKDPKIRPDLEAEMLKMVNSEREKIGLKALKADPELVPVARAHSTDMFARGYFSHISPEGATPFDRIKKENVSFLAAGENLALAQTLTIAHRGLMNSPGHKANILHKSFGRLGIGIMDGGVYGIMVTQVFRN